MRTMLRVCMDVEAANKALRDGSLQETIESVSSLIHPETTFFTSEGGKRTAYFIFQLADPSQIPEIAEPFFQTLGAEVDLKPVMNAEELEKGIRNLALQQEKKKKAA